MVCLCLGACQDPLALETDSVAVFDQLWQEVDQHYAFFDRQDLDWEAMYAHYRPMITAGTSEDSLFAVASALLSELQDPHTVVFTNKGVGGPVDYFSRFPVNALDDLSGYFNTYQEVNRALAYGRIGDYGYLKICTFEAVAADFEAMTGVLDALAGMQGLIIDVRGNRGGYISNAKRTLAHFVPTTALVAQYRHRNGPYHADFSAWQDFSLEPNVDLGFNPNLPIAVLTNRQCYSACEWFVLGARSLANVHVVGDTTGGGSGIPMLRELPNGWLLRVSNSQFEPHIDFQFKGISPDFPVWISTEDARQGRDAILESAIELLKH